METLAALKIISMLDEITADDKILIILSEAGFEKQYTKFNHCDLHRIIYRAKNKNIAFLDEFVFKNSGTYPYSALLERILTRMTISRVFTSISPDYTEYKLADGTAKYINEKITPKLTPENYNILKQLASQLKQLVGD